MSDRGLLNDVLFKIVFGTAKSEPVLSALLNALLGYTGEQKIVSLTIENPTLEKEYLSDKGAILDLKAVDRAGCWYNIEVQLQPDLGRENYFKRSLFYWAKLYSGQIEQGHQYVKLEKTISISLLDFNLFSDSPNLHNIYVLNSITSSCENSLTISRKNCAPRLRNGSTFSNSLRFIPTPTSNSPKT